MNCPRAFTLLEVVVVLSSLFILFGVSFPAIQEARGANDIIECQSRIGALALGCLDYLEVNEVMPPLNTGPLPAPTIDEYDSFIQQCQNTGTVAHILPFIGQNTVYDSMPHVATNTDVFLPFDGIDGFSMGTNPMIRHPGMTKAYSTKIPELICPANIEYASVAAERLHFMTSRLTEEIETWHYRFSVGATTKFGRISFLPSMGGFPWDYVDEELGLELTSDQVSGALRIRNNSIPPDELADGSSGTILFGECNGWIQEEIQEGVHFNLFGTSLITGYELPIFGLFGSSENSFVTQIGSNHIEGNNLAMTDGSTMFISRKTDRLVMIQFGCGGDGD